MAIHKAICKLTSASAYSQSRKPRTPKNEREKDDAYDERVWRERMHVNDDGKIIIPAGALRMGLWEAAQYLGEKIPGKGNRTWAKKFESGVLILEDAVTGVNADDVECEEIFCSPNGKRGTGTRVSRRYPYIKAWDTEVEVILTDTIIDQTVFLRVFRAFGQYIGIGRWRPANLGMKGRFSVELIEWLENHEL